MADSIEILVDPSQAQAYIESKRGVLEDMLAERMDLVMGMFADRVKGNLSGAVLKTQTGKLLNTVMQTPTQKSGTELYASVQAGGEDAPYGIYFEKGGTGYYDIVPVNARVLAFMSEGQRIFAKIVHHPPTPHLPWFGPEIDPATEEMNAQLNAAFQEVLA